MYMIFDLYVRTYLYAKLCEILAFLRAENEGFK